MESLNPYVVKVVEKMYKNCTVNCKLGNETISIDYKTGVQQGDSASPVLFACIMQAFSDTLKTKVKLTEFHFSNPPRMETQKLSMAPLSGNQQHPKAPLSTSITFSLSTTAYSSQTTVLIWKQHYQRLGMQMHIGSNNTKLKTEAMFFPSSLKEAKKLTAEGSLPANIILPNNQQIQFTHSFKYLGSVITTELNEDAEVKIRINKAKSILGIAKHFFNKKDVNIRTKHNIYSALSARNKNQLESFHRSAIRRILNIKWQQLRDNRIRNKQVRF